MIRRREFIAGLGGATVSRAVTFAQQSTAPVVEYLNGGTVEGPRPLVAAFHQGLRDQGYVEGQNVSIEYHWLQGQFDRAPALLAELLGRQPAVIVVVGSTAVALAAKAAATTIPIVFSVGDDPVRLGLVASLARPGGNLTGVNFFTIEAVSKRLALLHDLVPKANRLAVLVNPQNTGATEASLREAQSAAHVLGLSLEILTASTRLEIEEAFAAMARKRVEALFVGGDAFFVSRRVQFATLAVRHGIAACFAARAFVEAGGLMSYGSNLAEMFRQIGTYTGRILKGIKPTDLPVVQSTKFELVINLQTARELGIEVPLTMLAGADEVID